MRLVDKSVNLFYGIVGVICNFTLCRERVCAPKDESKQQNNIENVPGSDAIGSQNGTSRSNYSTRSLLKSASISASKCVVVKQNKDPEVVSNSIFSNAWLY